MTKKRKLLEKVLAGSKNIQFNELVALVEAFGFTLSLINGSHHIFSHPDIPEIVNLQNRKGEAVSTKYVSFLAWLKNTRLLLRMKNERLSHQHFLQ